MNKFWKLKLILALGLVLAWIVVGAMGGMLALKLEQLDLNLAMALILWAGFAALTIHWTLYALYAWAAIDGKQRAAYWIRRVHLSMTLRTAKRNKMRFDLSMAALGFKDIGEALHQLERIEPKTLEIPELRRWFRFYLLLLKKENRLERLDQVIRESTDIRGRDKEIDLELAAQEADLLMRKERYQEAVEKLKRLTTETETLPKPLLGDLWFMIGVCHNKLAQNGKARRALDTALELSPAATWKSEARQLLEKMDAGNS